jgi:PEP-CTERM motif
LNAAAGDTASIDSTTTYFTFDEAPPPPVPEPSSLTVLGIGIVALMWAHQRKRRQ